MEKSTITIEIKQDVSILLLWIVGGILLVTIACYLPPSSTEVWPVLHSGGLAAMAYLLTLVFYIVRKPVSGKARILAIICVAITIAALSYSSLQLRSNAHWQAEQLIRIRAIIGRGVMRTKTPPMLLKTLQAFYNQEQASHENLAQIFQKLNGPVTIGANINTPYYDGDSMKVIVQTLDPDRVVLVSQETYIKGYDQDFKNCNGQEGMVQEKCILTAKGITYESEN
jgi:hypothetical protein